MVLQEITKRDIIEDIDEMDDNEPIAVEEVNLEHPHPPISVIWQSSSHLLWDDWYALFLEYKALFKKLPASKTVFWDKELGSWYCRQKMLYKKGKLAPERVSRLFGSLQLAAGEG